MHKFVVVAWNVKRNQLTGSSTERLYLLAIRFQVYGLDTKERVEHFPSAYDLTVNIDQDIRAEQVQIVNRRGNKPKRRLDHDRGIFSVRFPVWGSWTPAKIALFMYQKTGPTYFTTWTMETLPADP